MRPISLILCSLAGTGLLVLLLSGCASSTVNVERAQPLSYDGLTPLENTVMNRVWVREGFTLSGYTEVILDGADIRYRPVTTPTSEGRRNAASAFPVSPAQKAELAQLITEEFSRALQRLTLPQVDEPGPHVLLVRGHMLDVVSEIPPDTAGNSDYFIDSVGQATFMVELIDSQTSTVLVRATDTRSARTPGSNSATNRTQVRQLISRWADLLVDALNDLTTIDLTITEPKTVDLITTETLQGT